MKITLKKALYGLGLIAAAIALAYDQLGDGGKGISTPIVVPHPAIAGLGGAKTPAVGIAANSANGVSGAAMADRLRSIALPVSVDGRDRDAFAAPPAWNALMGGQTSLAPDQKAADFCKAHHLKAIINGGPGSIILLDGQFVRLGQWIDGLRFDQVEGRCARFIGPNTLAILTLDDASHPSAIGD